MVTMRSLALRLPTGIEHERRTSPFTWTEHEPHCETPQPYLVPVSPTCSRSTQSSGVSPSAFTSTVLPFTLSLAMPRVLPAGARETAAAPCSLSPMPDECQTMEHGQRRHHICA